MDDSDFAVHGLVEIFSGWIQDHKRLNSSGISTTWALHAVERAGQRGRDATIEYLSQHLAIDPSQASRVLSRCVADGYLKRTMATTGHRATALTLTTEGRSVLAAHMMQQKATVEDCVAGWSSADRLAFASYLGQILER